MPERTVRKYTSSTAEKASPNGIPDQPTSRLADRIAEINAAKPGTDPIKIAANIADPTPEERLKAFTMANAAKMIDSVKFLLHAWIPFGMVSGVLAEPGIGKSALVL